MDWFFRPGEGILHGPGTCDQNRTLIKKASHREAFLETY